MDEREKVRIQVWTLSQHTTKTQKEIAEAVGITQSGVSKILKSVEQRGTTATAFDNCGGHNKTFDDRALRHMRQVVVKNPRATAEEVRNQLGEEVQGVSVRTVRRALVEAGCRAIRPKTKPLLTSQHKAKRYQWARDHQSWTLEQWRRVLWSDETFICLTDGAANFVRVVEGHPLTKDHFNLTVKHPIKVMIWACFSYHGPGRAHVIEGSMNTESYISDVITRRVLPQMSETFPDGGGVFQQDNAPCHVSKRTKEFFRNHNVALLDWPPQSPDCSPIENLWALVKRKLAKLDCKNKNDLICAFIRVWNRDPEINELCKTLADSMIHRVNAVIEARGDSIDY